MYLIYLLPNRRMVLYQKRRVECGLGEIRYAAEARSRARTIWFPNSEMLEVIARDRAWQTPSSWRSKHAISAHWCDSGVL